MEILFVIPVSHTFTLPPLDSRTVGILSMLADSRMTLNAGMFHINFLSFETLGSTLLLRAFKIYPDTYGFLQGSMAQHLLGRLMFSSDSLFASKSQYLMIFLCFLG